LPPSGPTRRAVGTLTALGALAALPGCAIPRPPPSDATSPRGRALLLAAAAAHGMPAFSRLREVRVSYDGEWAPIIDRLQPALVDRGHRGVSNERIDLPGRTVTQAHAGPEGRKAVVRRWAPRDGDRVSAGEVEVRFEGAGPADPQQRAAAALVADGYALFLLGPLLLEGPWMADRDLILQPLGEERIAVDGLTYRCDVLRARIAPGLGLSPADELTLHLDADRHLMRRVRFTLEGMESTRGAVAEVDLSNHVLVGGVRWPTRFHERLIRPLPLPVHDWRLTALDIVPA